MTTAYPLTWPEGWPRTSDHKRAPNNQFKTTFIKARTDLLRELDLMGASGAVISSWLPLRNDGMPRADSARMRITDPGVAVYFQWRKKSMVIARDVYSNVHDNLRSIGLAVAHLRGLERHGGGHMMERAFSGFMAIEAPGRRSCWATLGIEAGSSRDEIERAFRELAKRYHPDTGGTHDEFVQIKAARDLAMSQVAA
jgi:hypothetical protein